MMTVHEVSELTGVSIRALHHYHRIGLLYPTEVTDAGYRFYDDTALERLQYILLFKELQFPLKEIKDILDSPNFDRNLALEQQITLLQMKKEHLEKLINLAHGIKTLGGVNHMDFTAFDIRKIDEYAKEAREKWEHSPEYREYEEKSKDRTKEDNQRISIQLMAIFSEFGSMKKQNPADETVQTQVKKLQDYITEHYYKCSNEILLSLGKWYTVGGSVTENIDNAGGTGTAEFAFKAIKVYCQK